MLLLGCAGAEAPCDVGVPTVGEESPGNDVLVVILDDIGTDRIGATGAHPEPAKTPVLDALADDAVLFTNAYTSPVCSPSRASLMTGRNPDRTGVRKVILNDGTRGLPDAEVTVAEMLRHSPTGDWSTGHIGKWHVSTLDEGPEAPKLQGFQHFAGTMSNPGAEDHGDYWRYTWVHDDRADVVSGYLTSRTTDEAIELLEDLPSPFYVQVAYHAAHAPFHLPPSHLVSEPFFPTLEGPGDAIDQMIEAVDTEIGRLLEHVDLETTTVIVVSDNGTNIDAIRPPWTVRGAKGSPYDAGTRVPLIVAGAGVEARGSESPALVQIADIFATVMDIAGVQIGDLERPIDGRSLAPLLREPERPWRACLVSEFSEDRTRQRETTLTFRTDRYKLIRHYRDAPELYDMGDAEGDRGPDLLSEAHDSPEHRRIHRRLERTMWRELRTR